MEPLFEKQHQKKSQTETRMDETKITELKALLLEGQETGDIEEEQNKEEEEANQQTQENIAHIVTFIAWAIGTAYFITETCYNNTYNDYGGKICCRDMRSDRFYTCDAEEKCCGWHMCCTYNDTEVYTRKGTYEIAVSLRVALYMVYCVVLYFTSFYFIRE